MLFVGGFSLAGLAGTLTNASREIYTGAGGAFIAGQILGSLFVLGMLFWLGYAMFKKGRKLLEG